jgi:hypothetical protein
MIKFDKCKEKQNLEKIATSRKNTRDNDENDAHVVPAHQRDVVGRVGHLIGDHHHHDGHGEQLKKGRS